MFNRVKIFRSKNQEIK